MANDSKCLRKLESMREEVDLEIETERYKFFCRLYALVKDWRGQLPDLREIFRREEIEWLLTEDLKINKNRQTTMRSGLFIKFVIKTGYKDEPDLDENGRPLLRRTTPLLCVNQLRIDPLSCHPDVQDLFKIYDRYDLNYIGEMDYTHFHVACEYGCYDVVEKFLELGQDPSCLSTHPLYPTPLHCALSRGKYDSDGCMIGYKIVADLLLKHGANPNVANRSNQQTPLHMMCQERFDDKSAKFMRIFFEINDANNQKVDINARDMSGKTPLHFAMENPKGAEVGKFLLERGADPDLVDNNGSTPLIEFCRHHDDYDLAKLLFEIADAKHQTVQVDRLFNGYTPLHLALIDKFERFKIAELLLKRGANPNLTWKYGLTPLHMIFEGCCYNDDFLEIFVEKFFDITYANGYRVDIDAQDAWGQTPLHLALANKRKKVAKLLLEYGADPNLADAKGKTPLHYICQLDKYDKSIELLNAFFNISDEYNRIDLEVDAQDKWNQTPLRLAFLHDNYKMSKLLLRRGADLDLVGLNRSSLEYLIEAYGDD